MGQSLSQKDNTDAELLKAERSMRDKLECAKAKLYIDALNDECIAIVCAVAKFDGMLHIEDTKKDPKDDIKSIMGSYLHMEDNQPDDELIELVANVVRTLLTHKQETVEGRHTHVVYANKGFIRFDYFIYVHILDDGKRAVLSYYGQVGLMDVKNAKSQVLIYELRRATSDRKLERAGRELQKLRGSSMKEVGQFLIALATGQDQIGGEPSTTAARRQSQPDPPE